VLLIAGLCSWLDKRALLTASTTDLLSQRMAQDGSQSWSWSQDIASEIAATSASSGVTWSVDDAAAAAAAGAGDDDDDDNDSCAVRMVMT